MIEPGTHDGIAEKDYHAWAFNPKRATDGPISCSVLKQYARLGPPQFALGRDRVAGDAVTWGSLVDTLALDPAGFGDQFVLAKFDNYRTAAARKWKRWHESRGHMIIDADTLKQAKKAAKVLRSTPASAEILNGARLQVVLVHSVAGIPTKARLDLVPHDPDHDDCLADLKTTNANLYDDDALARQVGQFRVHWQAAFYLHLWNKLNPDDKRRRFKLIYQSSTAPFEVRVVELDELMIEAGFAAVKHWLALLTADCRAGFRSRWYNSVSTLPPHNPTIFAEEAAMDLSA